MEQAGVEQGAHQGPDAADGDKFRHQVFAARFKVRQHWHPLADEWLYFLSGEARMGVYGANGNAGTFDYQAGDVGYVPFAMGHYVENTGTTPLRFLEMFKSSYYADVSLDQWIALTPPELVQAHLRLDPQTMNALRKRKKPIVPA